MLTDRRGFLNFIGGTSAAAVVAADAYPNGPAIVDKLPEKDRLSVIMRSGPLDGAGRRSPDYEVVPWSFYDRVEWRDFTNGRIAAFSRPSYARNGYFDTNMCNASALPAPHMFIIHRLSILLDPDNHDADIKRAGRYMRWRLFIGRKVYAESLFALAGLTSGKLETMVLDGGKPSGLVPQHSAVLPDPFGILIDRGQQFYVNVEAEQTRMRADPRFAFYVILTGLLARPLQ